MKGRKTMCSLVTGRVMDLFMPLTYVICLGGGEKPFYKSTSQLL